MGSFERIEGPARNRALRLLVGLLPAAFVVLLIQAEAAKAISCSGTIKPVPNAQGREVPTLSFRCDGAPIGGSYSGRLFQVTFDQQDVVTMHEVVVGQVYLDSPSLDGQCEPMDPPLGADPLKSYVLCYSNGSNGSPTIPAGTTITGTPFSSADSPVCPRSATVTVYGADAAPQASFPLTSTCPVNWIPRHVLTVEVFGGGTVTGDGISCRGSCTYRLPMEKTVSLTAVPAKGSTFAGWGDSCRGTRSRCAFTLDDNAVVSATFRPSSTAAGRLHLSVDRAPKVTGTTASVLLGCHAPKGGGCKVVAVLTTKTKKPATIAKRTLTIPSGAQRTVSLSLNAAAKSQLKRSHTLATQLTASLTNSTKPTVVFSKTVTFKQ